jgi:hypothetical protein
VEGGAVEFDGESSYALAGNGPALGGKTDFTIVGWFRTDASKKQTLLAQRGRGRLFNGQVVLSLTPDGHLMLWVYGDSSDQFRLKSEKTFHDGAWHFVAAVRDGNNGYIYVDGNEGPVAMGSGPVRNLDPRIPVTLGRDIRALSSHFKGKLDDFRIYSIAKSPAELRELYEKSRPRKLGIPE